MSAHSRDKGARAEREVCALIHALTGWEVSRRVRNYAKEDDIQGAHEHGWSVEVKWHAKATRADIKAWWAQAEEQAYTANKRPLLAYRRDRDEWRFVWPLSGWTGYELTVEGGPEAWAAFARENA